MNKFNNLYTNQYSNFDINNVLKEHPFPQFRRDSYLNLNGIWQCKITKDEKDLNNINQDILVPFCIESKLSLINKRLNKNECIIYKKEFKVDKDFIKDFTFIHFLGVDQKYKIILNNHEFDEVIPLNLPTKIDISNYIKEHNTLYVIVKDNLDPIYPLGKQSNKPKGIFYTPFSGIYFPVFIESVSKNYIKELNISTSLESVSFNVITDALTVHIKVLDNDTIIYEGDFLPNKDNTIKIDNPIIWNVDNPHLYNLELSSDDDLVYSYFGLRTVNLVDNFVYLNNEKIFLNGILDQGYYPEGIITPCSYECYKVDILTMKELGFNTLRKHIKVELPYFYYLCDKYGMLVMQDFVNNGKYSFFKDTALPTIGLQVKNDKRQNKKPIQRQNFIKCGENLIKYLSNNPCIVAYTIFNEGWGQFDSQNVYNHFKKLHPDLIFDTASGWFRGASSDLDSYHWYFKNIDKIQKVDHPIFLSEFGALCYKVFDHAYGSRNVFGYKYFKSLSDLEDAFVNLYTKKIIPYKDKLIGTIYTQLSDVEEEDNGLLTYDRKILKLNKKVVQEIMKKLV